MRNKPIVDDVVCVWKNSAQAAAIRSHEIIGATPARRLD